MSDEFDDVQEKAVALDKLKRRHEFRGGRLSRIPELVADVYSAATSPLRTRLLECLLQPVGPLGLVAIAAGAFGEVLHRGSYKRLAVSLDDASRISADQMLELARYVEQCSPDTFQQIASLLAENPLAMTGLAGSALLFALQAWRKRGSNHEL
jgi:hypothetical protein